jgi:transposase/5-methylcytosine-specific restriction endonuclease McrA
MDRELLEAMLAEGMSLAAIGRRVGRHESTVAYWLARYGLRAARAEKHAARGALARDQLERLVQAGMTIAEIADQVGRSKATVRHWLERFGLRTVSRRGRRMHPDLLQARRAGATELVAACPKHGATEFVLDRRGYYRCRRCRAEAVTRRRQKVKELLVAEAGGACRLCGYSGTMGALHFHHLDPREKRFELNAKGVALALETLRAEARKCVLLCSNCHAEVEERGRREPGYRPDFK